MIEINQIQKIALAKENHIVFKLMHKGKKLMSPVYEEVGNGLLKCSTGELFPEIDAINGFAERMNEFIKCNPEKFI